MRRFSALFLFALILPAPPPAFAQNPGIIEGAVADQTGAVTPGALADLGATETGPSIQSVRTDEQGRFHFPAVRPGNYYVRFRAAGFFVRRRGPLTVNNGVRIDTGTVHLPVGLGGGTGCWVCENAAPRFLIDLAQNASFGGRVNAPLMDLNGEATLTPSSGAPIRIRIEDDGFFKFEALPPGRYALRVSAPGYAPFEVPDIGIAARASMRIDGWITFTDCPAGAACKPTRTVQRERNPNASRSAFNETPSPSRTSI